MNIYKAVCLLLCVVSSVAQRNRRRQMSSSWGGNFDSFWQNVMDRFSHRPSTGTSSFKITFSSNGRNTLERLDPPTERPHGGFETLPNEISPNQVPVDPLPPKRPKSTNMFEESSARLHKRPIFEEPSVPLETGPTLQKRIPDVIDIIDTITDVPTVEVVTPSPVGRPTDRYRPPVTSKPTRKPPTKPSKDKYCTSEYEKIPGHTLCLDDDKRVDKSGLAPGDIRRITKQHNDYRSKVQPAATDLVKLIWDDRVAAVAQKWANQCKAAHDKNKHRKIPSIGMSIGQNVAGGYRTWREAIFHWWDEIRMWKYGVDPDSYLGANSFLKIGHFTQMAQNGTYLLGCGYAECNRTSYTRFYVCNYAAGQSNLAAPYTAGRRCAACPNSCRRGQCDCKGKICYNGGKLDPNTCTCTCVKPYGGPTCQTLKCPAEDKFVCERDWPRSHCELYYNVPQECPYMCGICKSNSTTPSPTTTTFTSEFGCKYSGKRSTARQCRRYGYRGQDTRACATRGGKFTCGHCEMYYNLKRDMCPVMCGLCDPPCKGMQCRNDGDLDSRTCTCKCKKPFEGKYCEKVNCTIKDEDHCSHWEPSFCTRYTNVPGDCRHMCGLC